MSILKSIQNEKEKGNKYKNHNNNNVVSSNDLFSSVHYYIITYSMDISTTGPIYYCCTIWHLSSYIIYIYIY